MTFTYFNIFPVSNDQIETFAKETSGQCRSAPGSEARMGQSETGLTEGIARTLRRGTKQAHDHTHFSLPSKPVWQGLHISFGKTKQEHFLLVDFYLSATL